MRMAPRIMTILLLAGLGPLPRPAKGVDAAPVAQRRFVLVGVISDDASAGKSQAAASALPAKGKGKAKASAPKKGVAVLKDRDSKTTLTIETGQTIPYSSYVVEKIDRQLVILRDGASLMEVHHEGSADEDEPSAKGKKEAENANDKDPRPSLSALGGDDDFDPDFEDVYSSELETDLWFFDNLRANQNDDEERGGPRRADARAFEALPPIFSDPGSSPRSRPAPQDGDACDSDACEYRESPRRSDEAARGPAQD